ncbi:protein involved in formation of curli polymers [Caulobacter sp. AP07]|uniref:SH3 domain-containing protein n=1 Tax=Caulobacter sp. AP07 TaxID=1144304 RepID=UPI0002722534|nr:SH3 domain-containing protein [Caulobacter sp. AP07]EJL31266.1 protein involved in formation of curli polymers [Caulobacter sp. AP07]
MKLLSGPVATSAALSFLLPFYILAPSAAFAQAKPSKAQQMQTQAMTEVPHCARKLGTVSIMDGDDPRGWMQYNLASPQKLLKAMVQKSGCFNLVDRGAGLNAAQIERNVGGNLGLQRGSNVGQGQVKAADYVLVAEVQASDSNSGGGAVAGALGGMLGGRAGGLLGGIKTKKLEANTVLSLTNVRTTETVAVQDGYAVKNDIGWGAGGGWGFGGAVGGGYESTDIGRIVTLSFINSYTKLVTDLGLLSADVPAAQAAPAKTFVATRVTNMRATAVAGGKLIRALPAGAIVYPTGQKNGLWWEVADENDNVGWVLNTGLEPAK